MVREVIDHYLPPEHLEILRVAEDSEREQLGEFISHFRPEQLRSCRFNFPSDNACACARARSACARELKLPKWTHSEAQIAQGGAVGEA